MVWRAASRSPDRPLLQLDLDFAMAMKFSGAGRGASYPSPQTRGASRPASILLASEGSRISAEAVTFAADLSRESKAPVLVFIIARIWGSAFGLPHPSLMPTKGEWQSQTRAGGGGRRRTEAARRRGDRKSRQQPQRRQANRRGGQAPWAARRHRHGGAAPRHWFIANFFWEQEPYRVRRLAGSPVYLVVEGQTATLGAPASAATGTDGLAFVRPISGK